MREVINQFRAAISSAGLTPPEVIEPDGKLHRFPSSGRRGDDAGWYNFHGDDLAAGAFGCWRTGVFEKWRADLGRQATPQEEAEYKARVAAARLESEAEDTKRKTEARQRAAQLWAEALPAPADHPYLLAKGIDAFGLRVRDGKLLVPLYADGELQSLQSITSDAEKRFLPGGPLAAAKVRSTLRR